MADKMRVTQLLDVFRRQLRPIDLDRQLSNLPVKWKGTW
jgi:hypothetical protein